MKWCPIATITNVSKDVRRTPLGVAVVKGVEAYASHGLPLGFD
ncbi:hypothetical protein OROGR_020685 [Orobanche gracilis]